MEGKERTAGHPECWALSGEMSASCASGIVLLLASAVGCVSSAPEAASPGPRKEKPLVAVVEVQEVGIAERHPLLKEWVAACRLITVEEGRSRVAPGEEFHIFLHSPTFELRAVVRYPTRFRMAFHEPLDSVYCGRFSVQGVLPDRPREKAVEFVELPSETPEEEAGAARMTVEETLRRLGEPWSCTFVCTSFTEAVSFLAESAGVRLMVDSTAFETLRDTPLDVRFEKMPLGIALKWMLHLGGFDCGFRSGSLLITAPENTDRLGAAPFPFDKLFQGNERWPVEMRQKVEKQITVDFKRTPVGEAIESIGEQTGASVVLDPMGVGLAEPEYVTLAMAQEPAEAVLKEILERTGLDCRLKDFAVFVSDPKTCEELGGVCLDDVTGAGQEEER